MGVRNNFYIGHYDRVIEEAKNSSSTSAKTYYYRSLAEVDPKKVFKEVTDESPTAHQAVKFLATYRQAEGDNKDLVINEWLQDDILKDDKTLQLIAAQMYFEDGNYKDAMKLLSSPGEDLEKLALQVQILLKMDRLDLAGKIVKSMQDVDDDDPLTQLAQAWLYVCQGGDKVTEASFLLQGLMDIFGQSIPVLVTLAVCQLHMGNASDAFSHLKAARNLALAANNKATAETLVNSMVCMAQMGKAEIIPKMLGELEALESSSSKTYLSKQASMEDMFDKYAKHYTD